MCTVMHDEPSLCKRQAIHVFTNANDQQHLCGQDCTQSLTRCSRSFDRAAELIDIVGQMAVGARRGGEKD